MHTGHNFPTNLAHLYEKRWVAAITTLTLILVIAGAIVALPHPQHGYAAGSATLKLNPTSGAYTNRDDQAPISVNGTNYAANEMVKIYWNYTGPNTGILEATITASNKGNFSTSFLYQLAATGTYTIAGVGQTSGAVATALFTLYPQLSIRPQASGPSSTTTFYGNAFAAGETVNIYWQYTGPGTGTLLATAIGDANGSFAVNGTIPNARPAAYRITAIGQTSKTSSKYKFTIYQPTLALAPLKGSANTPLTVSAYGFTGGENVNIFWNNSSQPIASATTSSFGYLNSTVITVPAGTTPGTYPVKVVGQTSDIAITNTFTVVAPTSSLSISSGPVGVNVKVTGQGYAPNETVNILWNYTGTGTGTNVATATAGISGTFQANFAVPIATNGSYTVATVGTASQTVTQNTFIKSNSLATNPASTPPGQNVTAIGSGFQANESVKVYWNRTSGTLLATTTADTNGNISQTVTIPANGTPGQNTVISVGQTSGLSFTTPITIDTPWDNFGLDYAHHRENIYDQSVGTGNVGNLKLKWTASTKQGLEASPVYANGIVYQPTSDGFLNAYNATTGSKIWQFNCQCIFRSFSAPLVDTNTNMVFFGTVGYADEGIPSPFYALDAQSGTLLWSVILPWHTLGFPTLAFNNLYLGTSHLDHGNCQLLALDEVSGHFSWQYATDSGVWGSVAVDPNTQTVFTGIGNPSAAVVALDAITGVVKWHDAIAEYGPDDDVGSGITIANGLVYASSKNGSVYAFNESTGAFVWSTAIGGQSNGDISTQAVSAQGVLYVGSINNALYALNAATGALIWKTPVGGHIYSSPAIANGVVYFASFDQKIYALNASTGAVLWSYMTNRLSYSSPIFVNGWLYCGSTDGNLYAFSL